MISRFYNILHRNLGKPREEKFQFQGVRTKYRTDDLYEVKFDTALTHAAARNMRVSAEMMRYRVYNVCQLAKQTRDIDGDILFCGISWGVNAQCFLDYCGHLFKNKTVYLVDAWEGTLESGGEVVDYYSSNFLESVRQFEKYDNVKLIKGYIPEILSEIENRNFSFIHMDTTDRDAETASMDWLIERLAPHSIMVVDAYGSFNAKPDHYRQIRDNDHGTLLYLLSGQAVFFRNGSASHRDFAD